MIAIDASASGELERNLHRTANTLATARVALADAEWGDTIARLGVVADIALEAGLGDCADVECRWGSFVLTGPVRRTGAQTGLLPHTLRAEFTLRGLRPADIPGLEVASERGGYVLNLCVAREAALRQARGQRP